jgi:hypothetical protein
MKNKYLPSLVTGFGAAVLVSVPWVRTVGCCIIVPLASLYALMLHIKLNKGEMPIKTSLAILFGLMTGLWAAFFSALVETIITFVIHSNDFVQGLPAMENMLRNSKFVTSFGGLFDQMIKIYHSMANDIRLYGFSPIYTVTVLVGNVIVDSVFGMLGGVLGMTYLNNRSKTVK